MRLKKGPWKQIYFQLNMIVSFKSKRKGHYKVRKGTEKKHNETKRNKTQQNRTKRNGIEQNGMKDNEMNEIV